MGLCFSFYELSSYRDARCNAEFCDSLRIEPNTFLFLQMLVYMHRCVVKRVVFYFLGIVQRGGNLTRLDDFARIEYKIKSFYIPAIPTFC